MLDDETGPEMANDEATLMLSRARQVELVRDGYATSAMACDDLFEAPGRCNWATRPADDMTYPPLCPTQVRLCLFSIRQGCASTTKTSKPSASTLRGRHPGRELT